MSRTRDGSNAASAERRRWARQLLQIPAELPLAEARGEVLGRLADADYLPPPAFGAALRLVSNPDCQLSRTADDEFLQVGERQARDDVEAFAKEFFELPPLARHERWQRLGQVADVFPTLRARLEALRPGLGLDVAKYASLGRDETKLFRHLLDLFVLRPRPRAALRRRVLDNLGAAIDRWRPVALRIRRQHPELVIFDAEFLEALGEWNRRRLLGRRRQSAVVTPRPVVTRGEGSSGWNGSWIVVVVVMALVGGLRNLGTDYSRRSNPPAWPPSSNNFGAGSDRPDMLSKRLGQDLLKQMQEMQRRKLEREAAESNGLTSLDGDSPDASHAAPPVPDPRATPAPRPELSAPQQDLEEAVVPEWLVEWRDWSKTHVPQAGPAAKGADK